MPSQLHEALVFLFRNRPTLAAELLQEALGATWLPTFKDARVVSAELNDIQPAEYRADLVVTLVESAPVFGIILEVQLAPDERKRFVWPSYVTNLRARIGAEACLLVVTSDEATARWAARPIRLGGSNEFTPLVLGPSAVPIVTGAERARSDPELAVLSAMAHGRDRDAGLAARIAAAAQEASSGLDENRARLYVDLVLASLSKAARRELQAMDPAKYEYQSEFAKRYIALGRLEGKAEGKAEGKMDLLERLLRARFGAVPEHVLSRLRSASIDELDAIGERIVTARTLEDALGPT